MQLPKKGIPREKLFGMLESFRTGDLDWQSGRAFGYIYDPGEDVRAVGKDAFSMYLTENGLDFSVFPSLLKIENDLTAIAAAHLGGDDQVVGNFSSGGTESIIMAVKAARDYYRSKRPDITAPEMILPATAHAAFHKAAHYLGIRVVQVPVRSKGFRADPAAMRAAVTKNTIMMVGSAPSYAHGVVDPIREIGEIALENDLWLHTDACVGGFMLPYFRRLGADFPDFDFTVPGVCSISMDLHKYAYTPKGASMVLYRSKVLRKHQLYACASWTGYSVINNAVQSSKSGGPMAAAWAVLHYVGDDGYLEIAKKKREATRRIAEGIDRHPDLRLMAWPDMCMLSFTSDKVSVFHIIDEMNSRGWYIQAALSFAGSKENIHMSINVSNVEWVDTFLKDLDEAVATAAKMKSGDLTALVQGALAGKRPTDLTDAEFAQMMEMAGIGAGGGLPERMAEINEVLNALTAAFRERLLVEFVNDLFRPTGQ